MSLIRQFYGAQIDATLDENKPLATRFGISGFPTLKACSHTAHSPRSGQITILRTLSLQAQKPRVREANWLATSQAWTPECREFVLNSIIASTTPHVTGHASSSFDSEVPEPQG